MDPIKNLLGNRKRNEPAEISAIKDYIDSRFHATASVLMQDRQIIITVPNASLAGTLRMHLPQLADTLKTDKRLVIRIGK